MRVSELWRHGRLRRGTHPPTSLVVARIDRHEATLLDLVDLLQLQSIPSTHLTLTRPAAVRRAQHDAVMAPALLRL